MTSDVLDDRPLVDLVFFDAGGGHRASAHALKAVIERGGWNWRVRLTNLRDVLEPVDPFSRIAGIRVEDVYNGMLKRGLTLGTGALLRSTQILIRQLHAREVARLSTHWFQTEPDIVVSMIPNFNRAILQGLRAADSAADRTPTPMVTLLTDMADYPPHFWIERQEQYVICGTETAAQQALLIGHAPERVFRTSGMIVRPEFYDPPSIDRAEERVRLGLDPALPTGIVVFGGFGSRRMLTIAKRVAANSTKVQLIFLCGRNERLKERLAALELPFLRYITGFTDRIPFFMRLADFFIGKPGPGSLSEAFVMGLPAIVERNAFTMVQERFNTDWIRENELGVVLSSFDDVADGVRQICAGLPLYQEHVKALDNRAVFEVPAILDSIMKRQPVHSRRGPEEQVGLLALGESRGDLLERVPQNAV